MAESIQWTRNKPVCPPDGEVWYWRRWKPNEQVEVARIKNGRVWFSMGLDKGWPLEEVDGEWLGPITPRQLTSLVALVKAAKQVLDADVWWKTEGDLRAALAPFADLQELK